MERRIREIYIPEEVHAGCKGNYIRKANYALAFEEFTWNHRVCCKLPLPHNPSSNEREAEKKSA